MTSDRLSIVIPVYNEAHLLPQVVQRIDGVDWPGDLVLQMVIVNDGSTDGTREIVESLGTSRDDVVVAHHEANRGKGAALRTGFKLADGDHVIIQDADLEYDPADIPRLLEPLRDGRADVVFGSRFIGQTHRVLYYWHYVGNRLITCLSNMLTNLNLTDIECCYKAFGRDALDALTIEEDRFGVEPELTAKVARLRLRVYETPVSYAGRTYDEGKKITWRDGFKALWCIVKYNLRP